MPDYKAVEDSSYSSDGKEVIHHLRAIGQIVIRVKGVISMTITEIIEQLKSCEFECEAGPLEMNTAFIELERHAAKVINVTDLKEGLIASISDTDVIGDNDYKVDIVYQTEI